MTRDGRSAIAELCKLVDDAGLTMTLDFERDITKPCVVCGTKDTPRELRHVPGVTNTRPVCGQCLAERERAGSDENG